jgi:hypothetical protein
MNTRYAPPGTDPEAAPERHLASAALRGINIGLNVVVRVAAVRTDRERRAMIWLTNYARLQGLTADALSERIGIPQDEVRAALTDPGADIRPFVRAVEAARANFEKFIPSLVRTAVTRDVTEAIEYAGETPGIVEIIGHNRTGKTESAWRLYLRMLDRALWIDCPEDDSDRTFLFEIARAGGIGTGTNKKPDQIRSQVKAIFGEAGVSVLFVDEAHRLWPSNPKTKPKRIEFLRSLVDAGKPPRVSVIVIATEQFAESLEAALDQSTRWAPGQWQGRAQRWVLPETLSDAELDAVARHHAPDAPEEVLRSLVLQAKASQGFCGIMVNTIRRARFIGKGKITRDSVDRAQIQMARGTKLEQAAQAKAIAARLKKGGRR